VNLDSELAEICRWVLQILYDDYHNQRYVTIESIAIALEYEEEKVSSEIERLVDRGLILFKESGYRLSEYGYMAVRQKNTSFCPYL
jgi:Mn-dependent DtxR family transcriptional regulator